MNADQLSDRLGRVAAFVGDYVPKTVCLADIGTDHAYLPVHLVKAGLIASAIAGDMRQGPYQSAVAEVAARGLGEQIAVRLGDGLEVIQDQDDVGAISICGMGGKLIADILDRGRAHLKEGTFLLLQPNNGEAILRRRLQMYGATILDEAILCEDGYIYEFILARIRPHDDRQALSAMDILLGPFNRQTTDASFAVKWREKLALNQAIIQSILQSKAPNYDKIKSIRDENHLIERGLIAFAKNTSTSRPD